MLLWACKAWCEFPGGWWWLIRGCNFFLYLLISTLHFVFTNMVLLLSFDWTEKQTLYFELRKDIRLGVVAYACNPNTLGGRGGWIRRAGDGDDPGQHGETPSLLKIQKDYLGLVARAYSVSYSGGWGRRIACTRETEPGSELRSHHCTPTWWQSKTPSQKKKIYINIYICIYIT